MYYDKKKKIQEFNNKPHLSSHWLLNQNSHLLEQQKILSWPLNYSTLSFNLMGRIRSKYTEIYVKNTGNGDPAGNFPGRLILVNIIFRYLKHCSYSKTLQYQHSQKHLGFILVFPDVLKLFNIFLDSSLKVTWNYLNIVGFFFLLLWVFFCFMLVFLFCFDLLGVFFDSVFWGFLFVFDFVFRFCLLFLFGGFCLATCLVWGVIFLFIYLLFFWLVVLLLR